MSILNKSNFGYQVLFVFSGMILTNDTIVMEKRTYPNITYLALYQLKENRKNQLIAYRKVWAQQSVSSTGELQYQALADYGWKSSEGKKFNDYQPREIFNVLTSDYIGFDNARNNELIKKYVAPSDFI